MLLPCIVVCGNLSICQEEQGVVLCSGEKDEGVHVLPHIVISGDSHLLVIGGSL